MTDEDGWVTLDRHWCLTEDRSKVVPETDPEARWLHWIPGQQVGLEEARRLGAVKRPPGRPKGSGVKKALPAENKKAAAPENKSGSGLSWGAETRRG